jgi:hypothetical protein
MDIEKGIRLLEIRREVNRRYYVRKHGIRELTDEEKALQVAERAIKKLQAYERQKARQMQRRHERGLKPLGRPRKLKLDEME